jgi:serine/threonine protein kinase
MGAQQSTKVQAAKFTPRPMKQQRPSYFSTPKPKQRQNEQELSPSTKAFLQSPSRAALSPATSVQDYVIDEQACVGEGSFANVMLATHVGTGKRVAVKVVDKGRIPEGMLYLMERECDIIRLLSHRNIIRILHAAEDEDHLYFYMPYAAGGDVHSYIEEMDYVGEAPAFRIFSQLFHAVAYCHSQSVIHRDIKLENMLLTDKSELSILLCDFGFSVIRKRNDDLLEDYPGSPAYAAPELMRGVPYTGYNSDIWAMGVVLYMLVCGAYPFWDEDKPEMYRQILEDDPFYPPELKLSTEIKDLINWMLMKNEHDRPSLAQIKEHAWMKKFYVPPPPVPKFSGVELSSKAKSKKHTNVEGHTGTPMVAPSTPTSPMRSPPDSPFQKLRNSSPFRPSSPFKKLLTSPFRSKQSHRRKLEF